MLSMTTVKPAWHKISCVVARQFFVVGLVVLSVGLACLETSVDSRLVAQDIYWVTGDFDNDDSLDKPAHEISRTIPGATKTSPGHSAITDIAVSNLCPLNFHLRGSPLHSLS